MNKKLGNALLIYGGGLCDPANVVMRQIADQLVETCFFERVFVGFNSFEAMLNPLLIKEWGQELCQKAEESLGGFFGTCRDVWLTEAKLREEAIFCMKPMGIKWIFVCGGDGSARNCAEIAEDFEKEGIKIAFLMPCTVDGIEGSRSIGIRPAVRASCKIIEQLASTCLNTRTGFKAPGLVIELQGRNRDDILANVMYKIDKGNIHFDHKYPQIFVVPANYKWNWEMLAHSVNKQENLQTPVLVLVSEGATDKLIKRFNMKTYEFLEKQFDRKTHTFEVAHFTQMNGLTNAEDIQEIESMLKMANTPIKTAIQDGKPFSISYNDTVTIEDIGYYKKLNPSKNQNPTLKKELEETLLKYVPF